MRSKFNEELALLHKALINMGSLCEMSIEMAVKALISGDSAAAEQSLPLLDEINEKEREIESMCMKLLLRQQPVATDLRTISSALKMVTDLQRIGDNSGDIAEIVTMCNISAADDTKLIQDMAKATIKMVTDSIDAFVKEDTVLAKSVIEYDDVVDGFFNEIKTTLIQQFGNPHGNGEKVLDLLMIAKYLERMADHAVEIAKWVIFSITGEKAVSPVSPIVSLK